MDHCEPSTPPSTGMQSPLQAERSALCRQDSGMPVQSFYKTKENSSTDSLESLETVRRRRRGRQRRVLTLATQDSTAFSSSTDNNDSPPPPPPLTMPPPSPMRLAAMKLRQRLRRTSPTFRQHPRDKWLIPASHPLKRLWDICTMILSFVAAYVTHTAIRDRSFGTSIFGRCCEVWFLVDLLLNFVTEHRTAEGTFLRHRQAVWARYLTTWFVIDALSLFPWESLYIKPIIDMQNRRNVFKKSLFRTRAVLRVSRLLRGRHVKLFGQVARHTRRHAGVGANRLLRLLIKYVPKYLMFYRNMKGVLMVRTLRQVHWMRKVIKGLHHYRELDEKEDDETRSVTTWEDDSVYEYDDDDNFEWEDELDDELVVIYRNVGKRWMDDLPQANCDFDEEEDLDDSPF